MSNRGDYYDRDSQGHQGHQGRGRRGNGADLQFAENSSWFVPAGRGRGQFPDGPPMLAPARGAFRGPRGGRPRSRGQFQRGGGGAPGRFMNNNRGRGQRQRGSQSSAHNRGGGGNGSFFPRNSYNPHQSEDDDGQPNPWLTPVILQLIQERNELYEMHCRENTELSHRMFKVKRIEVNMAINDAKYLYFQQNPGQYTQHQSQPRGGFQFEQNSRNKSQFYCEPCDKKLASQVELDEHLTEHITCKLDGCTYTAHAKLVMKHIELQHSNGLYLRIKGYDTPEQIQKWKDERRTNFPTPENIARKRAERKEMKERGETMDLNDREGSPEPFRYKIIPEIRRPRQTNRPSEPFLSDDENGMCFNRMQNNRNITSQQFAASFQNSLITLCNFYTDIEVNSQNQLVGSSRETWMTAENDMNEAELLSSTNVCVDSEEKEKFNITDDEDDAYPLKSNGTASHNGSNKSDELRIDEQINTTEFKLVNDGVDNVERKKSGENQGLLGLVNYSSDSEDGNIPNDDAGKLSTSPSLTLSHKHHVYKIDKTARAVSESDSEAPEETTSKCDSLSQTFDTKNCSTGAQNITSNEASYPKTPTNKRTISGRINKKNDGARRNVRTNNQEGTRQKRYTLLQRLLAPDIRRERNLILQACRYIVEQNFFDDHPSSPQKITNSSEANIQNVSDALSKEKLLPTDLTADS